MKVAKKWLMLPNYFESADWKEIYKSIEDQRPLIFIFVKKSGEVEEVQIRQGRPNTGPLINRRKVGDPVVAPGATIETLDEIIDSIDKTPIDVKPIPAPEEPEVLPPVVETEPTILEATPPPEVASSPAAETEDQKDGEVSVGRWVEYKDGDLVKQGKIAWISSDEKEFLIKPKSGSANVVPAEALLSLLPDLA